MSEVTKVKKITVSVNKEISAVGGYSAINSVKENGALTPFADSEYLVTP